MMLAYVNLDALLDEASEAELAASPETRAHLDEAATRSWIFHDLQLEGVSLTQDDLDRAFSGVEGADYCDRVLLDQIRRYRALTAQLRADARAGRIEWTLGTLLGWRAQLDPEGRDQGLRAEDGPTEQYKHEVLPAAGIEPALAALLQQLRADPVGEHPVQTAIHAQFELLRIWPFRTWSALVARLVSDALLLAQGYPPLIVPVHERHAYYSALHYERSRFDALLVACMEEQARARLRLAGQVHEPDR